MNNNREITPKMLEPRFKKTKAELKTDINAALTAQKKLQLKI